MQAQPQMPMAAPQQSGGMLSGIGSSIVTGMAVGTGSAIAHRVVGSMFGGSSAPAQPAQQPVAEAAPAPLPQRRAGPCDLDNQAFMQCMQQNPNNLSACDFYLDALKSCQSANPY